MTGSESFTPRDPVAAPAAVRPAVLLVEDEEQIRALLTDVLQLDGCNVFPFADGRVALRFLEGNAVDVIVTDLCMPDFDGFEFLTRLRTRGAGARILVISGGIGHEVEFYLRTARHLGATETLQKPFPLDKLLGIVRGMMRKPG